MIYPISIANQNYDILLIGEELKRWFWDLANKCFCPPLHNHSYDNNGTIEIMLFQKHIPCSITDSGWKYYRNKTCYRIWTKDNNNQFILELNKDFLYDNSTKYLGIIALYRIILFSMAKKQQVNIIHAASVAYNGKGILLAAPGGTGKSTCCKRLPNYWKNICDDTSIIVNDKNVFFTFPMPTWSDLVWNRIKKNYDLMSSSIPISSIFFLCQSDILMSSYINKTLSLVETNQSILEAWRPFLFKIGKKYKESIINNGILFAENMTSKIPCYYLELALDSNFWQEIEKKL